MRPPVLLALPLTLVLELIADLDGTRHLRLAGGASMGVERPGDGLEIVALDRIAQLEDVEVNNSDADESSTCHLKNIHDELMNFLCFLRIFQNILTMITEHMRYV